MTGSGSVFLGDVQEWSGGLRNIRECSGGPPGYPGVFGRPSRMSGCGRETLGDVREALPVVHDCLGCSRGFAGEVRTPLGMSGSGRESLLVVR